MQSVYSVDTRENIRDVGAAIAISAVTLVAMVALSNRTVSIEKPPSIVAPIPTPLSVSTPPSFPMRTGAERFNRRALEQSVARGRNLFEGEVLASLMDPSKPIDDVLTRMGRLGGGGYGWVSLWRGPDGKQVAIKEFLDCDFLGEWGGARIVRAFEVDRFQEFQIGLELDHPNFLKVHNLFVKELPGVETPRYYLLTEFVDGQILFDANISSDQVSGIIEEMLDSMRHAVQKGIGPNDLHGANIMITSEGHCKWIDFGFYRTPETLWKNTLGEYLDQISHMLLQVAPDDNRIRKSVFSILNQARNLPIYESEMSRDLTGSLDAWLAKLQNALRAIEY